MTDTCHRCDRLAELLAELLDPNIMTVRATASRIQANLTNEPRAQVGSIADYLTSGRVELIDGAEESVHKLHIDYYYWSEERGFPQVNTMRFGKALTRLGIGSRRGSGGLRLRTGIRLT